MAATTRRPARLGRADALAMGFLALLACALMAPFLWRGRTPLNADFLLTKFEPWWRHYEALEEHNDELDDPALYTYPIRGLSAEMLRRGIVPLWNPYIMCGIPLLADDVSLPFDPFGLLAVLLPFPVAWGTIILAQLLVASWSMYALMRHYGCSRPAAALSGATLMLCGTFTVWLEYISWIGTFCWAPLCLLWLDLGIRRSRMLPFVGVAVLLAFTLLGGLIQLALYFFAMTGFYGLWQIVARHRESRDRAQTARSLGYLACAFGLAVLLSSAQLLPTLEAASMTFRRPDRYWGANHLSAAELVTYLAPNFYDHPTIHDGFPYQVLPSNHLTRHGGYIGVLPLVLALLALGRARRDRRVACHAVMGFGTVLLLVVLGLGLERSAVAWIPGFGSMHAVRLVVVYSLSAAVLAGFGLDSLLAAGRRCRLWVARAVGLVALSGLVLAVCLTFAGPSAPEPPRSRPLSFVEYLLVRQSRSPGGTLLRYQGFASALMLLGAAWALLRFGPRLGQERWSVWLVALAAADLFWQASLYNPFVPRALVYPPTAATQWVRRQPGVFRISGVSPPLDQPHPRLDVWDRCFKGDMLPPDTALPYRFWDARGKSSIYPKRLRQYNQRITRNPDIRVLLHYDATQHRHRLFDLLSARYVLSAEPLGGGKFERLVDGPVGIYENRAALPRVHVVPNAVAAASDEEAFARLERPDHAPERVVVVDREPPLASKAPAAAEIETYGPNEVLIRITRPGGGFLVLTDTWYPGWRAYVDGHPRPILRANVLMRCVALRPGDREVRFVYEPESFRLGLFLSLVGVAVVFAALGASWASRRARR